MLLPLTGLSEDYQYGDCVDHVACHVAIMSMVLLHGINFYEYGQDFPCAHNEWTVCDRDSIAIND